MILCSDKLKLKKLKKTPQLLDLKDLFWTVVWHQRRNYITSRALQFKYTLYDQQKQTGVYHCLKNNLDRVNSEILVDVASEKLQFILPNLDLQITIRENCNILQLSPAWQKITHVAEIIKFKAKRKSHLFIEGILENNREPRTPTKGLFSRNKKSSALYV